MESRYRRSVAASDSELWKSRITPGLSCGVSRDQIERVLADPVFRKNVDDPAANYASRGGGAGMVSATSSAGCLTCVAYFSMEFMLSEALPIYSGGLGNVAGDQLKAASDLGVPVVGVGLLYQQGYFRQVIDKDGSQRPSSPITTPGSCRSRRCATRTASGCAWRSPYPVTRSGCAVGRSRSADGSFTCWTAMTRRTFLPTEGSPASCMGAGRSCASSKNCFSGSADGGCLPHWAFNRKSVTSMKGMRPLLCWSAPEVSWKKPGSPSSRIGRHRAGPLHHPHGSGCRL